MTEQAFQGRGFAHVKSHGLWLSLTATNNTKINMMQKVLFPLQEDKGSNIIILLCLVSLDDSHLSPLKITHLQLESSVYRRDSS